MQEYIELLKEYLGTNRSWNKNMYRIGKAIYKGIERGATEEQVLLFINSLGGEA